MHPKLTKSVMRYTRKKPSADLRSYYLLFFEGGMIVVLLFMLLLTGINFGEKPEEVDFISDDEPVKIDGMIPALQPDTPESSLQPAVPAEIPFDVITGDPITEHYVPAGVKTVRRPTPPRPIIPAKVPVDVIIPPDPIKDLDFKMEPGEESQFPSQLPRYEYAIFAW